MATWQRSRGVEAELAVPGRGKKSVRGPEAGGQHRRSGWGKAGDETGGSRAQVTPLLTGQAEELGFTPKCQGSRVG